MEKKIYIEPKLKALYMDEELLAAVSDPIIDEDDDTEDLARENRGFFEMEEVGAKKKSVWDEE